MKILHVDMGKEWRGGQRQCALLHKGLLARGYDSELLCNEGSVLAAAGFQNTVTVKFRGEVDPLTLLKFRRIVCGINPTIVHSHEAHSLTPLVLLKKLGSNFHLVHTRRVDFTVKKNALSMFKYNYSKLNLVAISEGVKKVLVKDGIASDRINRIYSGVPAPVPPSHKDVTALKKELKITNDLVFGTVANFSPHKDLDTMLDAYAKYRKFNKKSKLLMVGDGPLFEETISKSAELGLEDNIIFTGFREDVPLFMKCMDIFLVSSVLEGLNTSIIDAMHLGLPVIATNTGGIGELVEDGVNGYLVPPQSPAEMFERMKLLGASEEDIKRFGAESVKKAACFTDDSMVENYINLYTSGMLL